MSTQITQRLDELSTTDVYSLILFALYKVKNIPEYSTLSELAYIMDKRTLTTFLQHYGGLTIRIPTIDEMKIMLDALFLYQEVNINHKTINAAIKNIKISEYGKPELMKVYNKIITILKDYDFKRE